MKIGILVAELEAQGGCERQALCLARELQFSGHQVTLYTCELSPGCYPDLTRTLTLVIAGRHPLSYVPLPGRLRAWLDMRHLARSVQEPIDVLNPHGWPAHWAALSAARRLPGCPPVVWMCNDYLWPQSATSGRRTANPIRALWRWLVRRYDRAQARAVDRVVVLSEMAGRQAGTGYGISTTVVRSGSVVSVRPRVSTRQAAALRRRLGIHRDSFLLLFVGILMPHRRLEDVLQALAEPPLRQRAARLLVVGDRGQYPAYARRLADLAQDLGMSDRVTWAGAVPEAELPLYYQAADAFIFPNENQTWGLAISEAMACGKPAIVSTGCGFSEVLTDGVNALLVPPRRPDLIAQQAAWLIDNPQGAAALAEAGGRLVSESLSWTRYAQSMLRLFEEALRSRDALQPATAPVASHREAADA